MKYAIIADIHGNLKALQIALADIERLGCDDIACLGDILGVTRLNSGESSIGHPRECLKLVRDLGMHCVKGNVDEYCSSDSPLHDGFGPKVIENITQIRAELSEEDQAWIRALPHVRLVAGFTIVHASLCKPTRWEYVFDKFAAAAHFEKQETPVCFFGHTHLPVAFIRDSSVRGGIYSKFKVETGPKYFVNPGSVGQPRDGSKQGSYACYDLDKQTIELRKFDLPLDDSGGGEPGVPWPGPYKGRPPKLSAEARENE